MDVDEKNAPFTEQRIILAKELNIPKEELNEAIAIAMTVNATKVRTLAGKIHSTEPTSQPEETNDSASECKT